MKCARHRNRTLCDGTDAVAMVSLYEDADDRLALANKKYGYYCLHLLKMSWAMGNPECTI